MIEQFEYSGIWWLPDCSNKKISGRLRFNQSEGAILELDGCFTDNPEISELFHPVIVNGVSSNGFDITLHRCLGKSLKIYSGSGSTCSLYAHEVFVGVHFNRQEDIKFSYLDVHFSNLDAWVDISGFETRSEGEEIIIRYKSPNPITALVSSELAISINFGYSYSPFMLTEAKLKQSTYISLFPVEERHFDQYLNIIRHFQDFLSLSSQDAVYPTFISGLAKIESYKQIVGDKTYYPQVKIFYQLPRVPQTSMVFSISKPLFTFKSIKSKFESYLQNWFGKAYILKPVHQLYFGFIYNPDMYLEQKFLCLIQALESYHRRVMKNYDLPEEEHNERIKSILDVIPTIYKEWLSDKLKYSNEPNFRKRLKELINKYPVITKNFIENKKHFIQKVYLTRNYFTHYDLSLEKEAAKGKELHDIIQKLKILVEMYLLKEIGFSSDNVDNLLSAHYSAYKI